MKKTILFIDNKPEWLDVYSRLLEQAGYDVVRAGTLEEAQKALREKRIHLGIFDIRMEDDGDQNDISGLLLAQSEDYRPLPKIILTAYGTVEYVRRALGTGSDGFPAAVNFVGKEEAHEMLIEAVKQAFERHVRINWNLVIQVNEHDPVTFHHLATLVAPGLEGELLRSRSGELEDLFRRLCYEADQIKIERVLWRGEGRVAVALVAFTHGKAPESLLLVCGENAAIRDEARAYREFGPKAPGETGTLLVKSSETIHFAANAYALAGANVEDLSSLKELYHRGPEKSFKLAVEVLFGKTLRAWHQDKRIPEEAKEASQVYAERVGLGEDRFSRGAFEERVRALVRQVPAMGAKIECVSGKLTLQFEHQSYLYADPTVFLYASCDMGGPTLLVQTPGMLSGENILADANGRAWLTDFGRAGLAPAEWNFVALEAAIRFDCVDVRNLRWLHQMEQVLVADESLKLCVDDFEAPLRRPLRTIEAIRRLASRQIGVNWPRYHLGIFLLAARRIADFNPRYQLSPNELARMTHVLIAAAVIAKYVGDRQSTTSSRTRTAPIELRVDRTNQEVWLRGQRLALSKQSYALLCQLNERANQLCTRRELVERALGERYDETDESQVTRLNTALRRLREKIEDDPDDPRYVLTEKGRGYRLALRSERTRVAG